MLTCARGKAVRTIFLFKKTKKIPEPPYQRLIGLNDEERNFSSLCAQRKKAGSAGSDSSVSRLWKGWF